MRVRLATFVVLLMLAGCAQGPQSTTTVTITETAPAITSANATTEVLLQVVSAKDQEWDCQSSTSYLFAMNYTVWNNGALPISAGEYRIHVRLYEQKDVDGGPAPAVNPRSSTSATATLHLSCGNVRCDRVLHAHLSSGFRGDSVAESPVPETCNVRYG